MEVEDSCKPSSCEGDLDEQGCQNMEDFGVEIAKFGNIYQITTQPSMHEAMSTDDTSSYMLN